MKIKLSRSKWEEMGRKAGWNWEKTSEEFNASENPIDTSYSDKMAQEFIRAFSDNSIVVTSSSLIADNVAMLRFNNGISLRLKLDHRLNDAGTFDIAMVESNGYSAF